MEDDSHIIRNAVSVDADGTISNGSNVSLHINPTSRRSLIPAHTHTR